MDIISMLLTFFILACFIYPSFGKFVLAICLFGLLWLLDADLTILYLKIFAFAVVFVFIAAFINGIFSAIFKRKKHNSFHRSYAITFTT